MSTQEKAQQNKKNNMGLLLRFLKGSKLLFVLSIADLILNRKKLMNILKKFSMKMI